MRRSLALLGIAVFLALFAAGCSRAKPVKVILPTDGPTVAPLGTPPAAGTSMAVGTVVPTVTPLFYATAVPAPNQGLGTAPVPGGQDSQGQATAAPAEGEDTTPQATYVVQAGDTLIGLAARFGTTVDALAEANNMSPDALLSVGKRLNIPSSAANPPNVHVVRAGETLTGIAQMYGVSYQDLASLNNLPDANALRVGQKLILPAGAQSPAGTQPTAAGTQRVHIVARGDTLYGIAAQYGVTAQALAQSNGLAINSTIYVGQRLVIP